MANDERPIFIFIPGAWHMPEAFDTIRELMSKRELDSEALALPSVGAEPPIKGLNDDISHVRSAIARLADQGRQIVLVVHSYGGMVGPGAVQGLEYAQRAQSGQKGGVIMFVYMAAFVAPKGNSLYDMLGRQWLPWMKLNGDYCYSSSEETAFYSDLPPDEQKKWKSKLKHISVRAFLEPAMHEPWHNLPCMYILCEKDQRLPIALQEQSASSLGSEGVLFRCQGSHSPFLSIPEKVIEGLELAAKVSSKRVSLTCQEHL